MSIATPADIESGDDCIASLRRHLSRTCSCLLLMCCLCFCNSARAQSQWAIQDHHLQAYFRREAARIADESRKRLKSIDLAADWEHCSTEYRAELLDMLGLAPMPERTALKPVVTGIVQRDKIAVEKVYFQSQPGLYVTANLYRPLKVTEKLPAVLYVCGHGKVKIDGVSYGNKVHYQHHGAWFARNGYVCLVIDSLELGEIEGTHHGTYRYDRWWWINRGYTPAGVEAWNCVRALDYLETREEVDSDRFGVTGRSGGGAYSWWVAAIDPRVKCAVPVAGITDLENHIVDGCVEGHCDCMFMLNTHRWDYGQVAALVAPRPLLISNTDTDRIFPLDGVVRVFGQVRDVYRAHRAQEQLGLHITAGGHKDTQELRIHAFRWINRHLKKEEGLITTAAEKLFEPHELKVLDTLPIDERNTRIDEEFVTALAQPGLPADKKRSQWQTKIEQTRKRLRSRCFAGWPTAEADVLLTKVASFTKNNITLDQYEFDSQPDVSLRLFVAHRASDAKPDLLVLNVLDEKGWQEFAETFASAFPDAFSGKEAAKADAKTWNDTAGMFKSLNWAMAYFAPRGIAPKWTQNKKKQIQIRRRFHLLGQSLDGMRVYDIRRALQSVRRLDQFSEIQLWLQAERTMAGNSLYTSLFEPDIYRLELHELPHSHRNGPFYLNVSRETTMQQTVAMAAQHSKVVIYDADSASWGHAKSVAEKAGWENQLQLRKPAE